MNTWCSVPIDFFVVVQILSSVQLLSRVHSLRTHESKHARPPCPSPTPRFHSDSWPSSQWCHPAISSSVIPFSSCPQSLPASESFPMSQFCAWGGQSTGVSALASFLPKKSCPTPRAPMDCSTPGFSAHQHLPEFARTHVLWIGDAIQPSHPLLPASPPAFNLSQHQGLFKWVSSIEKPTIQAEHLQVSMKAGTPLPHCSVYNFIPHFLLQSGDTVGFTCVYVSPNITHPKVKWSTWSWNDTLL